MTNVWQILPTDIVRYFLEETMSNISGLNFINIYKAIYICRRGKVGHKSAIFIRKRILMDKGYPLVVSFSSNDPYEPLKIYKKYASASVYYCEQPSDFISIRTPRGNILLFTKKKIIEMESEHSNISYEWSYIKCEREDIALMSSECKLQFNCRALIIGNYYWEKYDIKNIFKPTFKYKTVAEIFDMIQKDLDSGIFELEQIDI